uniref:Uncharacterized protein n=1 Tax=Timema tahoe TaxID=61484 RepID=A0A7R9FHT9_9NEOP|nr:unnamed protein product [Timema tahoe]
MAEERPYNSRIPACMFFGPRAPSDKKVWEPLAYKMLDQLRPISNKLHQLSPEFSENTQDRDSNLDLPVNGSLVYFESSALDQAVTEGAARNAQLEFEPQRVNLFVTDKPDKKRLMPLSAYPQSSRVGVRYTYRTTSPASHLDRGLTPNTINHFVQTTEQQ